LTDGPQEFTQADSVVPKMIISYTKRKLGVKYISSNFSEVIEKLIEDNEDLGLSPITNIPVRTDKLKEVTDQIFNIIIKSMKLVPYGLRYIAKKIYQISKERFPDSEEKEILRSVSFYVIYKFIGSSIANPDDLKL